MEVTVRNITKDTMVDFNNDHTITLPMEETKLLEFLGKDEWIIVDSLVGEEFTHLTRLNKVLQEVDEDTLQILSKAFLFNEIEEAVEKGEEFTIIDFDAETSGYNSGNGVFADDWWKGYVLHDLGYVSFPFEYKEEMEDYVKFEQLWYTADSEGWREVNYNNHTHLVHR